MGLHYKKISKERIAMIKNAKDIPLEELQGGELTLEPDESLEEREARLKNEKNACVEDELLEFK